jgi:hypothetical protein
MDSRFEYADFLEALRDGRVGEAVSRTPDPVTGRARTNALPVDRHLNWVLPSYDFANLFEVGDDKLSEVRDYGIELFLQGDLHLPFNPVVYMVHIERGGFLYRVHEEADGRFKLFCYALFRDQNMFMKTHSGWICENPDPAVSDIAYAMVLPRIASDADRVGGLTNSAVTNIIICTTLLTQQRVYRYTEPESEKLARINRGRALGKHPRLVPASKVIHLEIDTLARVIWKTGSYGIGTPKRPHDRRGHVRHFKDGTTTWVNATKIKGGAQLPPVTTVMIDA